MGEAVAGEAVVVEVVATVAAVVVGIEPVGRVTDEPSAVTLPTGRQNW